MKKGIYIHIPFCKSKCGYCSFNSCSDLELIPSYCAALIKEIEARSGQEEADTIYFGGGTPSVLPIAQFEKIFNALYKNFRICEKSEITVEANPESCSAQLLKNLALLNVNRVSLGLQSDDDKLLKRIGRIHSYSDFLIALDNVLSSGISNVSADLIAGLPGQTAGGFKKTISNTSALPLKHISFYALSVEEGTPFYNAGVSPDSDLQAKMYGDGVAILEDHGFSRYEVSNFAKAGCESRHNCKYWDLTPYHGFGLSAHSYDGHNRFENTDSLIDYISGKPLKNITPISKEEAIEEYVMLSLRTSKGLDASFLKQNFGYDIIKEKSKNIEKLIALNAVILNNERLVVQHDAFYILNSIILELI